MGKLHCPVFSSGWGDMEIIESDDGQFLIIDTYTYNNASPRKYVKKLLNGRKAKLLISHGHKDHNGDYAYYIKNGMVSRLYVSRTAPSQESSSDKTRHNKMIALAKEHKVPITYLYTGNKIEIGKGAAAKVIYARESGDNNAKSICLMVTLNGVKILLCGDAEQVTMQDMISRRIRTDCNILKLNHHGVKENTMKKFVERCGAEYAFCNCCDESPKTFRSWAKEAYSIHEAAGINCYSVLYNQGLVFDCRAGEVNVLAGGNTKPVLRQVKADGFTVTKQFHICNKEEFHARGSMGYVNLQLAKDCICGAHGNGKERYDFLGDKVAAVQSLINSLIAEYRDRMIAMEGGAGREAREAWLKKCGFIYDPSVAYNVIQAAVNKKLAGG